MNAAGKSARPWIGLKLAIVGIVAAAVTTGCGDAVAGRAVPGMTQVDLAELDYGLAPTEPSAFDPDLVVTADIYAIEARRMLAYLASPHKMDPDLRYLSDTSLIMDGALTFGSIFPDTFAAIASRNYLVAGAGTQRSNGSSRTEKSTAVAVLRFGNDHYARTAANEFDAELDVLHPGRENVPVPGYTDIHAGAPPTRDRGNVFAVKGPYVIVGSFSAPPDQFGEMGNRMKRLLDIQLDAMADLTPTPADDILDLPLNPEGIMNMVLPEEHGGNGMYGAFQGVYPPEAHIHFEYDAEPFPDYTAYGVDLVARNGGIVYRTGTNEQAFALQAALARPGKYDEEIRGPAGLADARCVQRSYTFGLFERFYCVAVYDRYVALVDAFGLGDLPSPELHQTTAAQYAILVNSR
ncbi:DUF7373 family lipoprotein [Nocardia carnea]|uniref:DUF7373 family lipoprotein n=1 Tax=Nocardia carnea TaxID=37328 RepID=UPI0024569144|nr:hypothetical protein [Nocardia carnea]